MITHVKKSISEGENTSTLSPKCNIPNAPVTYSNCETTENTCQGIPTCHQQTCFGTCYEATCVWATCASTCQTCSGNTCDQTCVGSPGVCINARFYGTMKWKNTYWNWPSGGITSYGVYLSPYYNLIDYDYWFFIGPEYGGFVNFLYGPGYG